MKHFAVAVSLALTGCAWDQYIAQVPTSTIATKPDPAAAVVAQCDRLGFSRFGEAHRLCVMRGIDRLAVQQGTGYAPIQILPQGHAFPSLAPQNSITVIPVR
jgi:hypothetical protein